MTNLTPEQEAAQALDSGAATRDLPERRLMQELHSLSRSVSYG